MSEKLVEHCQELVRVLQNDVSNMCDNMLLEYVLSIFPSSHYSLIFFYSEERDSQKCSEYFKSLKNNEDLLTSVLANLTRQMRSCHNGLNSKVHLPEAVFNKIMTEVVRESAPRERLFVGQICSHWRKRVLATRSLWSVVDLRWKTLSNEYLRRSAPLPIDVAFHTQNFYDAVDIDYFSHLRVLSPHSERLRTLALQIPQQFVSASLKSICSRPAPNLRSLILKGDDDDLDFTEQEAAAPADTINLFQNHTPNLVQVNLKQISMHWESPLFVNLTVLRLEACSAPASESNLLQILSRCPDLEALHVGKMRDLTRGISDCSPQQSEIQSLPKLRILNLQGLTAYDIRKLLWRLSLPNTTQLTISCCLDDRHSFCDLFPPLPHRMANIHSMKSLSISVGHRTQLRGTLYNHGGPILLIADLSCVSLERSADEQLSSVMSSLPFGNLERLTIVCKQGTRELPPELASKVLLAAPTIVYFSVFGVNGQDILRCLDVTSCTSITTFDCSEITFSEADLTAWLSRTSKLGLPLRLLEFSHCTGITDAHIHKFRSLVPEVCWDDEGEEFSWPKSAIPTRMNW